jgi:hypothetical protein
LELIDKPFWNRVWKAIQRILGAFLLFGAHTLLDWLQQIIFEKHVWLQNMLSNILLTAFVIVYLILLVEVVIAFIPRRSPKMEVLK